MINKIILSGNVVTDIVLNQTNNNTVYCQFLLAVPRNYKNKDGEYASDFVRCVVYGNYANIFKERVLKGQHIVVSGRLEVNSYMRDDNKYYLSRVIVDTVDYYVNKNVQNNIVKFSDIKQDEQMPEFYNWLEE